MSEEKEVDRRRRVAEEKIWGATIELVERLRKKPTARSIALRIITIYQPILDFQKTVKIIRIRIGGHKICNCTTIYYHHPPFV